MLFEEPKPVLQYSKEGIFIRKFPSENKAAKKCSISEPNICRALKKGIKAGKYYWRYDNGENHKLKIDVKKREGKKVKIYKGNLYLCTMISIAEAAVLTKVPKEDIRKHLKNSSLKDDVFTFEEVK